MKKNTYNKPIFYSTMADFVKGISMYGQATAIECFGADGKSSARTFEELCHDVSCLRRALSSRGLYGKKTAIAGKNSYEWLLTFLAVTSTGGIAVCIDINQDENLMQQLTKFSDAEIVFCDADDADIFESDACGFEASSVFVLDGNSDDNIHLSVNKLIESGKKEVEEPLEYIDPESTCCMVFSSGTTSTPKAVCLSHRNILSTISATVEQIDLRPDIFLPIPFYHAYGLTVGALYTLLMGAKIVISSELRFISRDIIASKVHTVYCVPLIVEILYKQALKRIHDAGLDEELSKLQKKQRIFGRYTKKFFKDSIELLRSTGFGEVRVFICGAAALDFGLLQNMDMLGADVHMGYGITECSPLVSVRRFYDKNLTSVGTPLPGYKCKLGPDGEILLQGPSIMKEYYKNPEETAEVMKDGWFHTGDIGVILSNGGIVIKGRTKNLIAFKNGNKVSPERIEKMLNDSPKILESLVTAVEIEGDNRLSVTVVPNFAFYEGKQNFEIINSVRDEVERITAPLPQYQQPQSVNVRMQPLDRNSMHKIIRKQV